MANSQKISQLTTAGPLTGAELVPVVQNSGTLQTTVSAIAVFATVSLNPVVSALQTQVDQVSARVSVNSAAITSINAVTPTKVNRIGDYMDDVQYIEFDTSTSIPVSVGRLNWDIEYGTLDLGLAGGNSSILVGQREVAYVYNNTAATLEKGKVVEVTGAQGQRLTVKLAQADNDANSATVLGIMLETVSVNRSGYAATSGIVRNVNTAAFTDGQLVYLSPVSAGELTPTKPVAPQHLVLVGYVVKGGSVGAGSIYVHTQNGYEIGELHDVKTSATASIANNEVLAYNTSAGVWTNSPILIETIASISSLNTQVIQIQASISAINSALAAIDTSAALALTGRVSALETEMVQVQASISAINSVLATIDTSAVTGLEVRVSVLEIRVADVSASVSALQVQLSDVSTALTSTNNVVSALEVRVSNASAAGVTNADAITSINGVVSALDIRVADVSASVSVLQVQVNDVSSALTSTNSVVSANAAAITSTNAVVSALDTRVANVSASVSALQVQVNAVAASVSVLQIQVNDVSTALTSANNAVSTLEVRVSSVSAAVSTLDIRVAAVSASVSALQVQVDSVSALVSTALVSVGQRVLKAGDTMTGALNISTSADAQAVSVAGYATFSSRVSISAGFYTGLQNFQDNTVQRATLRDYALVVVAKGSVSATTTLDLTEGNFFTARIAGSATFVFANPPVSVTGASGPAAGGFILELQNGGSATVTWPAAVDWPGGTSPTLTATGFDILVFITDDGGTVWRGVQSMKDSK